MIEGGKLTEISADVDDMYTITDPGIYSYHFSGDGYYNILKIVNITQEQIDAGMTIEVDRQAPWAAMTMSLATATSPL